MKSRFAISDAHAHLKSPPISSQTCNFTLTVSAPTEVIATSTDDTTVNVTWTPPSNNDGIDVFYAYINGTSKEQYCGPTTEQQFCLISGLQTFTSYTVCVRGCHVEVASTVAPTTAGVTELSSDATGILTLFTFLNDEEGNPDNPFCSAAKCHEVRTRPSGK